MEEKIKLFFNEAANGHFDLDLYRELLYNGASCLEYALKNNRLEDFKFLVTPQKYDDGVVRIAYDPFSDEVYNKLNMYLHQDTAGIKEFIDSLYDIDYDTLFQIRVKDSHARQISGMGHAITGEKDVIRYSEPACLKSMLKLYELNIDTWANDTEGCIEDSNYVEKVGSEELKCGIHTYYSRLDEENKIIVDRFIKEGFASISDDKVFLYVNCDREETIGEVSSRLLAIVSQLKIQDVKHYQFNEQTIRKLILKLYWVKYAVTGERLPYELLADGLVKYYEQFSLEEFPERDEAIQEVRDNSLDEDYVNNQFRKDEDYRNQILEIMANFTPLEKCVQDLAENGYYIDRENNQIFDSKIQYLRHLKYLSRKQPGNNIDEGSIGQGDKHNLDASSPSGFSI